MNGREVRRRTLIINLPSPPRRCRLALQLSVTQLQMRVVATVGGRLWLRSGSRGSLVYRGYSLTNRRRHRHRLRARGCCALLNRSNRTPSFVSARGMKAGTSSIAVSVHKLTDRAFTSTGSSSREKEPAEATHAFATTDEAQETSPGVLTEIPHPWAAPTVATFGWGRWRCAGFGCGRGGRVAGRSRRRV